MEEKRFASLSLPLSSFMSGFRWRTEGWHICGLLLPTLSHPHPLWEQLDLLAFGWALNAGTRSPCNYQCRVATTSLHHYRSQRGPITTRSTGERESYRDSHPLAVPLERTLYLSLVNLYKSKGRDHTFPSEALLLGISIHSCAISHLDPFPGGLRAAILYLARPRGWLPELRNWAHTFAVSVCDSRWQPLCRGEDGLG